MATKALAKSYRQEAMEREVKKIEDRLYHEAMETISRVIDAADFDDEDVAVPRLVSKEDEQRFGGKERAIRARRLIRDMRKRKSEEPAYIERCFNIVETLSRKRETEKAGPGFNINISVNLGKTEDVKYEVIDVDPEER